MARKKDAEEDQASKAILEQLQTKTVGAPPSSTGLTGDQLPNTIFNVDTFDQVKNQVTLQLTNLELLNVLNTIGQVTSLQSQSGPIPGTLKFFNFVFNSTGNNYKTLDIKPGEVWRINTLSIAEQGTGTGTISFALEEVASGEQSFFAVHSTTSQEPVPVTTDSFGDIFITSDFRVNFLVNNAGDAGVHADITIIRVR